MNIFNIISNLLGIGKDYLSNKQKINEAKQGRELLILEAETKATVHQILSNTDADNNIDLITARSKDSSWKDEFVSYIFLTPVVVATIVPFIIAFQNSDFANLNKYIRESYISLDGLPSWYKYILFAIVVDILGFRSMVRKIVEHFIKTRFSKDEKTVYKREGDETSVEITEPKEESETEVKKPRRGKGNMN